MVLAMTASLKGLLELLAGHFAVMVHVGPLQKLFEPFRRAGWQLVEPNKALVLDVQTVEQGVWIGPLGAGLRAVPFGAFPSSAATKRGTATTSKAVRHPNTNLRIDFLLIECVTSI